MADRTSAGVSDSAAVTIGQNRVAPFPDATAEEDAGQNGRDQNGKRQRAKKGERNRQSHRPEQAPLYPLQREDRHVRRDDDRNGVEHRALHFMAGLADSFCRGSSLAAGTRFGGSCAGRCSPP